MHTQSRSSVANQNRVGVAGGGHSGECAWVGVLNVDTENRIMDAVIISDSTF